ncbi:MAG TPA: hypothetical protein DEQ02_05190 [Ruminococcaceae bacterium]|nr:hypothetical protein [Oscillospiraceae bacterium]
MERLKKFIVIIGHYGSGKTTFALNLVLRLADQGKNVTLADLDIVNPYFRSSDYKDLLEKSGVRVLSPSFAGTTLDLPALPPEMYAQADSAADHVIFDVGGDDAGAAAFGGVSKTLGETRDMQAVYILNRYRGFIKEPSDALENLREIEAAARIRATHCVNNSHLGHLTAPDDLMAGFAYADEFSRLSGLPLLCTAVPDRLLDKITPERSDLFGVREIVAPPW